MKNQFLLAIMEIGGLFTWPNQDDVMNMTKISEHDQKIDNHEL